MGEIKLGSYFEDEKLSDLPGTSWLVAEPEVGPRSFD